MNISKKSFEKLNILHVITTIEMGGAENQLLILGKSQIRNGHGVSVLYLKGKPELRAEFEEHGIKILNFENLGGAISKFRFVKNLFNKPSQIIHGHLPRAEIFVALFAKKNSFVVTRHNAEPFYPTFPGIISRKLSQFVLARASKVIAISNAVEKYLIESGECKNINIITVVPYGYSRKFSDGHLAQKPNASNFKIGTIARLTPQKDIPTLLEAFAKFKRQTPHASLEIIGSGILEWRLKELAAQLGITRDVNWIGRVPNVSEYLANWNLFVLPSKYEGFGLVLLEACDAGLPILATRVSAIPEVLGSDYQGLFTQGDSVELSSMMSKLLDDNHWVSLSQDSIRRLSYFNVENLYLSTQQIYEVASK